MTFNFSILCQSKLVSDSLNAVWRRSCRMKQPSDGNQWKASKRGKEVVLFLSLQVQTCFAAKTEKIKRPQSTKDSPTLGVKLISIRRCPPCRLPLRVTFLILLGTESTLLSSALLFHEAAARTSEEIQAWMQQNSMNFLCHDCIVGFLRLFCHIFY